jgi:hypothetical protein
LCGKQRSDTSRGLLLVQKEEELKQIFVKTRGWRSAVDEDLLGPVVDAVDVVLDAKTKILKEKP